MKKKKREKNKTKRKRDKQMRMIVFVLIIKSLISQRNAINNCTYKKDKVFMGQNVYVTIIHNI